MNKIVIFSLILIFIFSYVIYEAKKMENKLTIIDPTSGTILNWLPDVEFENYPTQSTKLDPKNLTKNGQHLLIHFWATWCGPCEKEFPELVKLIHLLKNKTNLKFLLVAVNDDPKKMKKFLAQYELDLDTVLILEDKIDAHKEFGTYKMPESFLFNTENKVVKKYTGLQQWTDAAIFSRLKDL